MPEETTIIARKRNRMYIIGFLITLSAAIPTYFNSLFLIHVLDKVFGAGANTLVNIIVGIIYAASALVSIFCFVEIPGALKRFGNFKTTMGLLGLELASLAGLIFFDQNFALAIVLAFIVNFVTISLANFCLDIFLESYSSITKIGKIRGAFLTFGNIAWLASPVVALYGLDGQQFGPIYALSAFILIPAIIVAWVSLKDFKDPEYNRIPFWKSFDAVWGDRNIKGILMIQFLLQFFYAWMVIYTPVYLTQTMGFKGPFLIAILFIMLIPFLLIEEPLGRFSDRRHNEREILAIGFVVMAVFTGLIAFVTDRNIWFWAAILFMTRVGAAMVEVMTETYFFKKVDASKSYVISFTRMARPLAYVASTIIASLLFTIFDMKGLFLFLGFLMLYGIRYALSIEDTA